MYHYRDLISRRTSVDLAVAGVDIIPVAGAGEQPIARPSSFSGAEPVPADFFEGVLGTGAFFFRAARASAAFSGLDCTRAGRFAPDPATISPGKIGQIEVSRFQLGFHGSRG